MARILISFIGVGRAKADGTTGYQETNYCFPSGKSVKSSVFYKAILASGENDFERTILIGTTTSSWDALIDDSESLEFEGGLELYNNLKAKDFHLDQEHKKELESFLKLHSGLPVQIVAHEAEIEGSSATDVLFTYLGALGPIGEDDLLIDITHGFRSMPVLLMTALEFAEAMGATGKVEIIYGEFISVLESPVRRLNAVAEGFAAARAIRRFYVNWDGYPLAEIVEPWWPTGAKALRRVGDYMQGNILRDSCDSFRQLSNAIKDWENTGKQGPAWLTILVPSISETATKFSSGQNGERLIQFAENFAEKGLYGQAILALDAVIDEVVCAQQQIPRTDYKIVNSARDDFLNSRSINNGEKKTLKSLERTRNSIAHGGSGELKEQHATVESLPIIYRKSIKILKTLWAKYKKGIKDN